MQMLMMNNANSLLSRDSFSLQLIIEEGIFLGRLLDQHERFPDNSPCLILTVLPFLTIAEHDAIPFLNRKLGLGLPTEDARLTSIRHMTKSLDSKHFDFEAYSCQANKVIEHLNKQFYLFNKKTGSWIDWGRTNVGISYYEDAPIYASYSSTHLFTQDSPDLLGTDEHKYEDQIGFSTGKSGRVLLEFAKSYFPSPEMYQTHRFHVKANDWKYGKLTASLEKQGIHDDSIFFFFSELLMLLSSVCALRSAGYFNDAAWLKYSSLTLDHAWRAIERFSGYHRKKGDKSTIPTDFLNSVSRLLNRDEKKFINKTHPLRNAMMHYDFTDKIVPIEVDGSDPWTVMSVASETVAGMSALEYRCELFRVRDKLIDSISELISFPNYKPTKRPLGWLG